MTHPNPFSKVLVTGAAGFIGSNLCESLLKKGCDVVGIDNFDSFYSLKLKQANIKDLFKYPNFKFEETDILDAKRIPELFGTNDFDVVIHLAAKAGVRPSLLDPASYFRVNVQGTLNLLQQIKKTTSTRFVVASSSSVYGASASAPFDETGESSKPVSPYAASKKSCEVLCHTYSHLHGIPTTMLRFFTVYGPKQRPEMAIAKFIDIVERGEKVPMFGDGQSTRDYTFIDDIVDGIILSAEGCEGWNIYNLGNASPVTLKQMIEAVGEACGREPIVEKLADQPGDVPLTFADISAAKRDLGYEPKVSLIEGIKRYRDWLSKNSFRKELEKNG
jgi:UDP-glucuronate 4-epimerase